MVEAIARGDHDVLLMSEIHQEAVARLLYQTKDRLEMRGLLIDGLLNRCFIVIVGVEFDVGQMIIVASLLKS